MKNCAAWRWLMLAALLVTAGVAPARARLGESTAELRKRFGPPVKQLKPPGQGGLSQQHYLNHDLLIIVTLVKDRSVVEHYLKLKSAPAKGEAPVVTLMPVELAGAILQACSGGYQWRVAGAGADDIRYARDDRKALAVLMKKNGVPVELRVCDSNFAEALAMPRGN
ncbi:MAG: hypothetical protein LBK60_07100 [Verrucomicrobiales bacterium]|jgi:hypothetical protein|nr:hypothetical protein [Verrucomicrobiales bacterium]